VVLVLGSILVVIEDSWGWYYGIEWGRWFCVIVVMLVLYWVLFGSRYHWGCRM